MNTEKRSLGRPPKVPGTARVHVAHFAASRADLELVRKLAELTGAKSVSQAIRLAVANEYQRQMAASIVGGN